MTRTYRASEEGLRELLRWAKATPWATSGRAVEEATNQGWLVPVAAPNPSAEARRPAATPGSPTTAKTPREVALEAALTALLKGEGLTVTAGDTFFCPRCFVEARIRAFRHRPDCPLVVAQALLAEKGEGDGLDAAAP